MLADLLELEIKCVAAVAVAGINDLTWKQRYDMIFSEKMSGAIFDLLRKYGIYGEGYCDPDTFYEADVLAFVNYIKERLPIIRRLHETFERWTIEDAQYARQVATKAERERIVAIINDCRVSTIEVATDGYSSGVLLAVRSIYDYLLARIQKETDE